MNHRAMYKRPTRNVYEDKRNHETLLEIDAWLNPEKKSTMSCDRSYKLENNAFRSVLGHSIKD